MGFFISLVATVGPNPELHRGDSLRRWLMAGLWFVTLLILTWALVAWDRRRRERRRSGGFRMSDGRAYVNGEYVGRVEDLEIGRGQSGLDPAAPASIRSTGEGGHW